MRRNRKRNSYLLVIVVLLLSISIGYAYLSQVLTVDGTGRIGNISWDVHFENPEATSTSTITPVVAPSAPAQDKLASVSYGLEFANAGEVYEYTMDIKNAGTVDARILSLTSKLKIGDGQQVIIASDNGNIPSYMEYSVTYDDGTVIPANHLLRATKSEKVKIHVGIKSTATPEEVLEINGQGLAFAIELATTPSDGTEQPGKVAEANFATDSWEDIVDAYKGGKTTQLQTAMNAGTTKEVSLDLNHDGTAETTAHVRIVNLSTPTECSGEGFSQTACGLVLEFVDVTATHVMNSENTNVGGWPASEMKTYLNDRTADANSFYNALPSDLREKIIPTTVISGYGSSDSSNFTSTDSLYLLSSKEVGFDLNYDTGKNKTRVLDYYSANNSNATRIKKDLNNSPIAWWLRAARSTNSSSFIGVSTDGSDLDDNSTNTYGVTPSFRIG